MELTMCCPTLFGLEGIVADELRFGGKLTDVRAENGRVFFEGDENTLAWANLNLRCAERVLIRLGAFKAKTFDQLFEGVKALPWEEFIPADGAFPVKGHSLDSALHSIPDCQKIVKKAVVSRLSQKYGQGWFEESGAKYQIQFALMHDTAEIYLTPRAPVCTSAATARTATPHPCAKRLPPRWSSSPVGAAESRSSTRSAARARLPLKRP